MLLVVLFCACFASRHAADSSLIASFEALYMQDPWQIFHRMAWLEYLANVYVEAEDFGRVENVLERLLWWNSQTRCIFNSSVDCNFHVKPSKSDSRIDEWIKLFSTTPNIIEHVIRSIHQKMNEHNQARLTTDKKEWLMNNCRFWDSLMEESFEKKIDADRNYEIVSNVSLRSRTDSKSLAYCLHHPILTGPAEDVTAESQAIHALLLRGNWQEAYAHLRNSLPMGQATRYTKTRLAVSIIYTDKRYSSCVRFWERQWFLDRRLKQHILDVFAQLSSGAPIVADPMRAFRQCLHSDEIIERLRIGAWEWRNFDEKGNFLELKVNNPIALACHLQHKAALQLDETKRSSLLAEASSIYRGMAEDPEKSTGNLQVIPQNSLPDEEQRRMAVTIVKLLELKRLNFLSQLIIRVPSVGMLLPFDILFVE